MPRNEETLQLENVRVIFKNFRGEERQYNAAGNRVFSIVLDDLKLAEELIQEGWGFKPLKTEDDEIEAYFLQVKINFDSYFPPRIYRVTRSTGQTLQLDEKTIDMLDYLPIEYVDIILNPYHWKVRGETGVKAYVRTMYVVVEENALDIKWANLAPFDTED